jgi:CrcB protein
MPGEPTMSTSIAAPSRSAPRAAPAASTRPSFGVLAAIGVGGALGSVVRYELTLGAPASVSAGGFPWTTWWINVTGSLVLGLVATMVVERWPPTRYVRPFVAIGVCGGYTTWSTFMTESAGSMDGYRLTEGSTDG